MTEFQKKVWFNTEILAVYNDTSGFQHIKEVDDTAASFTFPDGDVQVSANCSMTRQISSAKCTLGKTFGCGTDETMWTSEGCRGVFVCDGVENVICDEDGDGKHTCKCKPGLKPPPNQHHGSVIPQVWMRPTADGGAAVVMHNPHDNATASITVDFTAVPMRGWTTTTQLLVRDLWEHEAVGKHSGKYTAAAVPPHGAVFVKLTES
jgi:alpha-galactosidase